MQENLLTESEGLELASLIEQKTGFSLAKDVRHYHPGIMITYRADFLCFINREQELIYLYINEKLINMYHSGVDYERVPFSDPDMISKVGYRLKAYLERTYK